MNPLRKYGVRGAFGAIPSGRARRCGSPDGAAAADLRPVDWSRCFIPTYNQRGPSCASEASVNILEAVIRFYYGVSAIPPGFQLDGYAVHRVVAAMFNEGDESAGACLDWPHKAMLKLGMIPPDTGLTEIEPVLPSIVSALQSGPLLQGLWIGPAWSDANGVNGQILEGWPIDLQDGSQGGHATALCAYEPRNGVDWLGGVNSWGQSFAWKGQFVISWKEWQREHAPIGDGPYQFQFNPHTLLSFDGWRKFLVRKYDFS